MKISGTMERIPQRDLRASEELAAFYIFPPHAKQSLMNLFSTHPPLEKRLAALEPARGAAAGRRVAAATAWACSTSSPASASSRRPAPDRLFAMTTAYVTFQTELSIASRGVAGIVFQPLATADFEQIAQDMVEVVEGTSSDSGTTVETRDDDYDYRWMILRDPDFDDLVVGVNAVSGALEAGGYGERILCAVFAFEDAQSAARSTGSTTTSAAPSTRSCPAAATSSATPSASCA